MGTTLKNQKGGVLVLFALLLTVLIGFCTLAMGAGYWYMVRAELSKSVDAGAFAGAKNISNPYVDPAALAEQVARENFPLGYAGTPTSGTGAVAFKAYLDPDHRIRVTGTVNPNIFLAQIFGVTEIVADSVGVAKKNEVEIMLVLDRSGSMGPSYGNAIVDLKKAAKSFIGFFEDTQDQDKLGLISFATSVTVDFQLGTNYVVPMTRAIDNMKAEGATNAEDALAQAIGPKGLTDQSGIPGDKRVQQFVIFFSDGNPTAFRGNFKYKGTDNIDAVVAGTGKTCDTVYNRLGKPDSETSLKINSDYIDPGYTGDGKIPGPSSKCKAIPGCIPSRFLECNPATTTKWYVFSQYPVPGYSDLEQCYIPNGVRIEDGGTAPNQGTLNRALPHYICDTARQMTLEHAQELKNRYVKIYTIGLGQIDKDFLSQIASGSAYEYYTPDSKELQAIFNAIAKDIKLRLVQ